MFYCHCFKSLQQIVAEYALSSFTLLHWKICHFHRMLKTLFSFVFNWRWSTLAWISIWSLTISTTFYLYTVDTDVAVVLLTDKDRFRKSFFFQHLLPFSRMYIILAETSFSVFSMLFSTKFPTCSRSTICFSCFSLPLLYSSSMASAQ